jgi:hypothetical protein
MNDQQWIEFLSICRTVCGAGSTAAAVSESWCAFTTFGSLETYLTYWRAGFPDLADLSEHSTVDGGVWGQRFAYNDLAHVIVPRKFRWETTADGNFLDGYKYQDIDLLSVELSYAGLPHRKTEIILEVKLF